MQILWAMPKRFQNTWSRRVGLTLDPAWRTLWDAKQKRATALPAGPHLCAEAISCGRSAF
jgi:hypothetical protein